MNKILVIFIISFAFAFSFVLADTLKDTLINMKSESSSSDMMGLDGLGAKPLDKKRFKKRSPKVVLATVNGHKIRKRDADKYLKKITKGKIKDYDKLPKKQQRLLLADLKKIYKAKYFIGRPGNTVIGSYEKDKPIYKKEADAYVAKATKDKIKDIDRLPKKQRLLILEDLKKLYKAKNFKGRAKDTIVATVNTENIVKVDADFYIENATNGSIKDFDMLDNKQRRLVVEDLAREILLFEDANASLSTEEKNAILRQLWLEKKMSNVEVSNEEMMALYEAMKNKALAENPNAQIPPYISLGSKLKLKAAEKKVMSNLMKNVEIVVNYDDNTSSDLNKSSKIQMKTL